MLCFKLAYLKKILAESSNCRGRKTRACRAIGAHKIGDLLERRAAAKKRRVPAERVDQTGAVELCEKLMFIRVFNLQILHSKCRVSPFSIAYRFYYRRFKPQNRHIAGEFVNAKHKFGSILLRGVERQRKIRGADTIVPADAFNKLKFFVCFFVLITRALLPRICPQIESLRVNAVFR